MNTTVIARTPDLIRGTKQSRTIKTGLPRSLVVARNDKLLPIYSLTPFTMLDFPERTACIIWFSGCNMRCAYCHNPQIVKGKGTKQIGDILDFLEKRRGLLDGVVLSGGEASIYPGLPAFVRTVKEMGYAVKLDTNGTRPDVVQDFLERDLLDYVALDYKAPPEKFKKVTGIEKFKAFSETLATLCAQNTIPFEIRTTVHTALMDENDINAIIGDLDRRGYGAPYYVQNFCADGNRPTLGFVPDQKQPLDREKLIKPQNFCVFFRNF